MKRIILAVLLAAGAGCFTVSRGQTPVEPEKAKNIRRLLKITGAHNLGNQMMELLLASLKKSMTSSTPDVETRIFKIYEEELRKSFTVARVEEYITPIYDKYLTGDEIIALLAFYESPLGQKTISVLPEIFRESTAAGEQLSHEVQERATERITTEVLPTMKTAPVPPPPVKRRPAGRRRT